MAIQKKQLDFEVSLEGWSVVVPGGAGSAHVAREVLITLLLGLPALVLGLSAFFFPSWISTNIFNLSVHPMLLMAQGLLFAYVGARFSNISVRAVFRAMHSTRLELSGDLLRVERRFLGTIRGPVQQLQLSALYGLKAPHRGWLRLDDSLSIPVSQHHCTRRLVKELKDGVARARHLRGPVPETLQNMRTSPSSLGS